MRSRLRLTAIWVCASFFGCILVFVILQTVASERVEVVELLSIDKQGEEVVTRLWVVDHEGYAYLRVGADGSGWFSRLQQNPEVRVRRGDDELSYLAVPNPAKSDIVNGLMQKKYTWGDTFFATVFGSRDGSVPIELQPVGAD